MNQIKHNWTHEQAMEIYNTPLLELIFHAASIHRQYHNPHKINMNTLISVRTGACSQDCKYCAQSSHYKTKVTPEHLSLKQVITSARKAKENGVKRVCLSSSGRDANNDDRFNEMTLMIREVKKLGLEVCCTMGMVNREKAQQLAQLGIMAVNHNLDTSEKHYPNIVSTRTYKDRLETLANLQEAGINYCSGGILGLGEEPQDRVEMLRTLANQPTHPYNIPLNALIPIEGTPLYGSSKVDLFDMARTIATARIMVPTAVIAFAAGRTTYSDEGQALCFMAGANSIFLGEKLLTVNNAEIPKDFHLLNTLGLVPTVYDEPTTKQD